MASATSQLKCLARHHRGQRGLALIVVLWTTAIITLLAAGFSFSLRTEARLAGGAVERAQGAAAANAGISWLMRELLSPAKGPLSADATLTFHGFDVAMQVLPENAKIDLNTAPEKLLEKLIANAIEETGTDSVSSAEITDALLDWRDADSQRRPRGAESADYENEGRAVRPRDGALLSVGELNQVMGMEPALFRVLQPLVTVHAWSTKVAPMSASVRVLRAVPGLSEQQIEQFINVRDELEDVREAIRLLNTGARYLARTESSVYTLVARATAASGVSATRRAVVKINGNLARPLSILAWYEGAKRDDEERGEQANNLEGSANGGKSSDDSIRQSDN